MRLLQITLLATATPIIPKSIVPANSVPFQSMVIQANGNNPVVVGDSSVSATRGIMIQGIGGSYNFTTPLEYVGDLKEWFLFGTAGDVVDILVQE
jgi:hypothetical protein